ncbi:MAG TPA: hypothetical protein VF181_10060 [Balneolaceae bacterium]
MDKLLLELQALGFPMLADWIHEGEIDLTKSIKHLEENEDMIDDEEDVEAFKRAEEIVRELFNKKITNN